MGMGIDFCTPTKPIPQPWVWWVFGGGYGDRYGGLVVGFWWWVWWVGDGFLVVRGPS